MKSFLIGLLFFVVTPVGVTGELDLTEAVNELVAKVDARYSNIQDLQADFTQETRIEEFDTSLMSSGRVLIKKPGLLRWNYREPSVEQIVVKGDQVDMFVPAHNQVLRGSLTKIVSTNAPLQLLQGAGKLAETFIVQPTGDGERGLGSLPLLTLIPKDQDRTISHIVSEIQPETFFIQTVVLFETSGNISTFRFTKLKANTGLDIGAFTLDLPKDVVIVEDVFPQ